MTALGRTTERLQQDHALLRAKIEVVKAALNKVDSPAAEVQEACTNLLQNLRQHLSLEERLVSLCSLVLGTFGTEELSRFAIEHRTELRYLKLIVRLLGQTPPVSRTWARRILYAALDDLTRHMEEQEAELFPILEKTLRPDAVQSVQLFPRSEHEGVCALH